MSQHPALVEHVISREQIQQRIQRYESSEIRFNLLALVGDKREQAEREV